MIRFKCGGCGKQYNVQPDMAGKQARCKQCGATVQVPAPRPATGEAAAATRSAGGQAQPPASATKPASSAPRRPQPAGRPAAAAARPAATTGRPAAAKPAPPKQVAADADPLGLGIDLDAFGPLGDPGLGNAAAGASLLAPAPLAGTGYRPKKKSNVRLWLLLGGGGVALVGVIVGVIVLIVNNLPAKTSVAGTTAPAGTTAVAAKTTVAADAEAYMPANWSAAGSLRLPPIMEWSNTVPAFKAGFDRGLDNPQAKQVEVRKVDELLVAFDGSVVFYAVTYSEPNIASRVLQSARPIEVYRGLQLYESVQARTPGPPGAMPSAPFQQGKTYSVNPNDKLLIEVSDLARLKAAIDQAIDGKGGKLDLPRQKPLSIRVKDLQKLTSGASMPANPMMQGIVGGQASISLSKNVDVEAVLDMKDAQAATNLQTQINSLLLVAKLQAPADLKALVDSIKVTLAGSQLQFSISVSSEVLAKLPPPGQMPMGGIPGQPAPGVIPGQPAPGGIPGQPAPGGIPGQPAPGGIPGQPMPGQ